MDAMLLQHLLMSGLGLFFLSPVFGGHRNVGNVFRKEDAGDYKNAKAVKRKLKMCSLH